MLGIFRLHSLNSSNLWNSNYPIFLFQHVKFVHYLFIIFLDLLFLFDSFLIPRTSFLSHGVLIEDRKRIIHKFGKFSYLFQLIFSIPLSWIGILSKSILVYLIFSFPKLFRIQRAFSSADMISRAFRYQGWFSFFFIFFNCYLIAVHFFACLFFGVASLQGIDFSWIHHYQFHELPSPKLYVICIYYVLTTITAIGFGDVTPQTSAEKVLAIFIQLTGVTIHMTIISLMVLNLIDPITSNFSNMYRSFIDQMKFKKISKKINSETINFFQLNWEEFRSLEKFDLPSGIENRFIFDICSQVFHASSIFVSASDSLLLRVASSVERISFFAWWIHLPRRRSCSITFLH